MRPHFTVVKSVPVQSYSAAGPGLGKRVIARDGSPHHGFNMAHKNSSIFHQAFRERPNILLIRLVCAFPDGGNYTGGKKRNSERESFSPDVAWLGEKQCFLCFPPIDRAAHLCPAQSNILILKSICRLSSSFHRHPVCVSERSATPREADGLSHWCSQKHEIFPRNIPEATQPLLRVIDISLIYGDVVQLPLFLSTSANKNRICYSLSHRRPRFSYFAQLKEQQTFASMTRRLSNFSYKVSYKITYKHEFSHYE